MNETEITIEKAASLLGISYDAALHLTRTGQLAATKRGSKSSRGPCVRWCVDPKSIEAYRESRRVYREPAVAEAAWAAGFIDGEGCLTIGAHHNRRECGDMTYSYAPQVSVANTDIRSLQFLADLFGGTICPIKRLSSRHAPCWRYIACSRNCERVLRAVVHYLIIKQEQAHLLLELADDLHLHRQRGARRLPETKIAWRESIRDKVSSLNGRPGLKKPIKR